MQRGYFTSFSTCLNSSRAASQVSSKIAISVEGMMQPESRIFSMPVIQFSGVREETASFATWT